MSHSNVTDSVTPPSAPNQEIIPPSPTEVARLLDTAYENRWWPLWTVGVYSGCRLGEVLGLKWDVVALDKSTIRVHRSLTGQVRGRPTFSEPKTPRSRRTIALAPEAITALRRQRVR